MIAAYKAAEALVKTLLGLCGFKDATQTFDSGSIYVFHLFYDELSNRVEALGNALGPVLIELTKTAEEMRTQALSACGQSGANAHDVIHRVGDETVLRMFHALGSEPGAEPGTFVTRSLCHENFDTVRQYLGHLDEDELRQLEARARRESLLTLERFEGETESSAISGGREVPGDDGSHHQGQTDMKNDTKKRPKKPRRRMNTSAYDCARRYKDRRKKDSTTTLKSVVEDYVEEVGADKAGTVEGILKRLEAHPEEWKSPDDNRHGTDT